jgi:hypothetical protein
MVENLTLQEQKVSDRHEWRKSCKRSSGLQELFILNRKKPPATRDRHAAGRASPLAWGARISWS